MQSADAQDKGNEVDGVIRGQECGIAFKKGVDNDRNKGRPPEAVTCNKDIASDHQGFAQALINSATTGRQKSGIGITWKQVCAIFKFVKSLLDFVWSSRRTIIFNGMFGITCLQLSNDPKGGSKNVSLQEFWRYRQKIHFVFT